MRKLSAKRIPKCLNAEQKLQRCHSSEQIWNFFGAIKSISCRTRWVSMDETWVYHYDLETKQQSMEWWHNFSPAQPQKIPRGKNPLESFSPGFFGIKIVSSSLIIFQMATLSTRSIIHLCWSKWRTIWRRKLAGISPRVSCSCTTIARITGHLQPRGNWTTWVSNILITHPILRFWLRRTTTCSLDWKKQFKIRHFSSEAEMIAAAANCWTDKILIFLRGLQTLE